MGCEYKIERVALIDLVDGHHSALLHLPRHHGVRSASREDEAERNRRLCHGKGSRSSDRKNARLSHPIINHRCARIVLIEHKKDACGLIDKPGDAKTQSPSYGNTCIADAIFAQPMTSGWGA